jgi:hypothetical protein
MRPLVKTALPTLLIASGLAALPSAAAAATTWTSLATGTTEEITALDYRADRLTFATSNGSIFSGPPSGPFVVEASFPGVTITEVDFSPNGTQGLATADAGRLFRYASGSWSPVDLTDSSYDFPSGFCATTPLVPPAVRPPATPTETLLDVEWADDSTAYVVSGVRGRVLRSVDGGLTFADASRQADGTCRVNDDVTAVEAVPGAPASLWFARTGRGRLLRTDDGLATAVTARSADVVNCTDRRVRLALDPVSPQRLSAVAVGCAGLRWGITGDGGQSATFVAGAAGNLHDVAAAPGVFLAVGDAGLIERTSTTREPVAIPASGADATTNWRAVEMLDADRAVVAGAGGRLAITSTASAPAGGTDPGTPPAAGLPDQPPVTGGGLTGSGKNFKMRVRGKIGLPAGVSEAQACRGKVKLTVGAGKRTLATSKAKVGRNCSYKRVIKIPRSQVGELRSVRLVVAFPGNQALGKSKQRYRVRVKR